MPNKRGDKSVQKNHAELNRGMTNLLTHKCVTQSKRSADSLLASFLQEVIESTYPIMKTGI